MIFQFSCPNGHVLSTDDTQQGLQCTCPQCQVVFLIPYLQGAGVQQAPVSAAVSAPAPSKPASRTIAPSAPASKPAADSFGGGSLGDLLGGGGDAQNNLSSLLGGGGGGLGGGGDLLSESIVHLIPCPKCKQDLETPDNMLDQEAACPYCGKQFVLRYVNSREAIEKREHEQAIIDARRGELWLRWSIVFAVIVILGLIIKISFF
jgi:hypothetical protein